MKHGSTHGHKHLRILNSIWVHSACCHLLLQQLLLLLDQEHLSLFLLSLLGYLSCLSLLEPLGVTLHLVICNFLGDTALTRLIFPLFELLLVHLLVESVHFAHLFYLIQVHDETSLICMVFLDAFAAKDCQVIGAVKMLNSLFMLFTEQTIDTLLILEIDVSQDTVPFYDLIQDIEVQRQLVYTFDLLHQLSADRAPYPVVVVESG